MRTADACSCSQRRSSLLGVHYTPGEVRAFLDQPSVYDVQTDQRKIRFSNSVISPAPGDVYLLQVGVPLGQRDAGSPQIPGSPDLESPRRLLAVAVIGRWMAARALAPVARLAAATRTFDIGDLHRRLPVRGAGDELDAVADAFNNVVARLERAIGEMKQFSAAMAHELRTPLAAIRGEIELSLTRLQLPADFRQALVSQLEEIDRLARLINQLLTLARAEAGEIPLAREAMNLGALSVSVVEALEPVAQAKDLALVCEVSDDVLVTGDAGWMERLLLNLLDNAIKFTPAGGRISVSVTRENATARLQVRDTGVGMTSSVMAHVFERFYRADSARSLSADGAGLGLSLVKWIADRHGATIEVVSRPGEGSTFTLSVAAVTQAA